MCLISYLHAFCLPNSTLAWEGIVAASGIPQRLLPTLREGFLCCRMKWAFAVVTMWASFNCSIVARYNLASLLLAGEWASTVWWRAVVICSRPRVVGCRPLDPISPLSTRSYNLIVKVDGPTPLDSLSQARCRIQGNTGVLFLLSNPEVTGSTI